LARATRNTGYLFQRIFDPGSESGEIDPRGLQEVARKTGPLLIFFEQPPEYVFRLELVVLMTNGTRLSPVQGFLKGGVHAGSHSDYPPAPKMRAKRRSSMDLRFIRFL
jgi:hypothetical protein